MDSKSPLGSKACCRAALASLLAPKSYEKIQGSSNKHYWMLLSCLRGCGRYLEENPLSTAFPLAPCTSKPGSVPVFMTVSCHSDPGWEHGNKSRQLLKDSWPTQTLLYQALRKGGLSWWRDLISLPHPLHSLKHPFTALLSCVSISFFVIGNRDFLF